MTQQQLSVGDFIEIPAWKVFGCVMDIAPSDLGSSEAVSVYLQEYPEQPARDWRRYRLEPDQFVVLE